jgi:hypothetical protein
MARQNLVGEATPELEYLCEGMTLYRPSVSRKYSAVWSVVAAYVAGAAR